MNAGNAITVSVSLPPFGSLAASDVTLSVERTGSSTPLATSTTGTLNYTIAADGLHFVRVQGTVNRGLRAQYLLNVTVTDGAAPAVSGTSLPAEGATGSAVIDRFTLTFSEDLTPASVNNTANYDLRAAGTDGTFGTADDAVYAVSPSPAYASGPTASYRVTNGPLQPGSYRLTVSGLTDRAGIPMAAPFVRLFMMQSPPGFTVESRSNNTAATATPLPLAEDPSGSGLRWRAGQGNLSVSATDLDF